MIFKAYAVTNEIDLNKIAAKCNISYPTVNSHISHIYEKLHVSSGTEAVAKAIEHNITGKNKPTAFLSF